MQRCLIAMCLAVLVVSAALAQQKKTVPPPPKPTDEGPSLEVTMKFIHDKLSDIGPVNYAAYVHDNASGNEWTVQFRSELTKVVADPRACRIDLHSKQEREGKSFTDNDFGFSLRVVGDIVVMPMEQRLKEIDALQGAPTLTYKVDPPVFVLKVRRTDRKEPDVFCFFDEQMANRVAKAMVHAVELCGGGEKPEPF
jgi:hypothetical protein